MCEFLSGEGREEEEIITCVPSLTSHV